MTTFRVGAVLAFGETELVVVERTCVVGGHAAGGFAISATKEPVAVIVRRRGETSIVDLDGRSIATD